MSAREARVRALWRGRERSPFLRWSGIALLALIAGSWIGGGFSAQGFLAPRRVENLHRFLHELRPYPLQETDWDSGVALRWTLDLLGSRGLAAAGITLAMAVAAIALAALLGTLLGLPAARNLATPAPFLPAAHAPGRGARAAWATLRAVARLALIFCRAIPEYVWAFLFLALLGPSAWPAVLALGLHNAGILGKLGAEVVENLDRGPLGALRGLGATRAQLVTTGVFPLSVSRLLLYFFYRWETCIREATVLGLLGIVSLGYWIADARARNQYDVMAFYILLGALLVLLGDLVSGLIRAWLRRA
ncbi:ABC transporter permease subunit [bacterium]|nr:ABC transporter permease subunit [bacterium]